MHHSWFLLEICTRTTRSKPVLDLTRHQYGQKTEKFSIQRPEVVEIQSVQKALSCAISRIMTIYTDRSSRAKIFWNTPSNGLLCVIENQADGEAGRHVICRTPQVATSYLSLKPKEVFNKSNQPCRVRERFGWDHNSSEMKDLVWLWTSGENVEGEGFRGDESSSRLNFVNTSRHVISEKTLVTGANHLCFTWSCCILLFLRFVEFIGMAMHARLPNLCTWKTLHVWRQFFCPSHPDWHWIMTENKRRRQSNVHLCPYKTLSLKAIQNN